MQAAVAQYPFMKEELFLKTVVQTVEHRVPPDRKPAFAQRLGWLKQIAGKSS
jgi:hypothetical protein